VLVPVTIKTAQCILLGEKKYQCIITTIKHNFSSFTEEITKYDISKPSKKSFFCLKNTENAFSVKESEASTVRMSA
jgi:hypothetical protein